MILLALLACDGRPEPLLLPDDPAERGVPVGLQTIETDEVTFALFYPAPASSEQQFGEDLSWAEFVPDEVNELLGEELPLPELEADVYPDAPVRIGEEPYPVVVFSHGFGGFRLQSVDIVVHLASRGYVVAAPDHPGRMLGDVLPCLFDELDGCDFSAFGGDDPGPDHVDAVMEWLETAAVDSGSPFYERLDMESLGLTGHSAGGSTTFTVGNDDERFSALLPMASASEGQAIERDVPAVIMGGACDFVAAGDALAAVYEASASAHLVSIDGAGHMAFSDLCEADFGALADDLLADRDDVNATILDLLVELATDGCPGVEPEPELGGCEVSEFADLEQTQAAIRHYQTVFFDEALRGSGDGVLPDVYEGVSVELGEEITR